MAKALILVSALCFMAIVNFAHAIAQQPFTVYGLVYCDPCSVEFQTKLSRPIPAAKVQLQCRKSDDGAVTLIADAVTGVDGSYNITVTGDHEEEICEVSAVSSPDAMCNLPFSETEKARVILTENNGVKGFDRFANPVGFRAASINADCAKVIAELDMEV